MASGPLALWCMRRISVGGDGGCAGATGELAFQYVAQHGLSDPQLNFIYFMESHCHPLPSSLLNSVEHVEQFETVLCPFASFVTEHSKLTWTVSE